MADKKISALTSASTPLAGTEVFPIVQGGVTVKTTIDDVNKGRPINLVTSADNGNNSDYSQVVVKMGNGTYPVFIKAFRYGGSFSNGLDFYYTNASTGSSVNGLRLGPTGNVTLPTGNLVIGTSGKGFSLPGGITWTSGSGSPEGVVTAPVGSLYSRSDGGLLTSLYVKESGSGNTGWVGK